MRVADFDVSSGKIKGIKGFPQESQSCQLAETSVFDLLPLDLLCIFGVVDTISAKNLLEVGSSHVGIEWAVNPFRVP